MSQDHDYVELQSQVNELKSQLAALQARFEIAPRLPSTGMSSDKFITRAFAVWGHNIVASLIIAIPFYILLFVIMGIGLSM